MTCSNSFEAFMAGRVTKKIFLFHRNWWTRARSSSWSIYFRNRFRACNSHNPKERSWSSRSSACRNNSQINNVKNLINRSQTEKKRKQNTRLKCNQLIKWRFSFNAETHPWHFSQKASWKDENWRDGVSWHVS